MLKIVNDELKDFNFNKLKNKEFVLYCCKNNSFILLTASLIRLKKTNWKWQSFS